MTRSARKGFICLSAYTIIGFIVFLNVRQDKWGNNLIKIAGDSIIKRQRNVAHSDSVKENRTPGKLSLGILGRRIFMAH